MSEILSFNNVKKRLGVSESTLVGMIQREKFPMKRNAEGVYEMTEKEFATWSVGTVDKKTEKKSFSNKSKR